MTDPAKKGNNFFFIDLNTTTRCNMRCKYCIEPFEKDKDLSEEVIGRFINKMEEFFNSRLMKSYDGITIGFWGGEASLNFKAMNKIIRNYENDNRIRFLIYSNGYKINHIKDLLKEFKNKKLPNNSPKIFYQISYDGQPAHGYNRLAFSGKGTVKEVRETIEWAKEENIPFSIKSTINRETFHVMDKCYADIKDILEGLNASYFPTIDYLTNIKISNEEKIKYYKALEKSLISIAEMEIDYFKKHNRYFFYWFNKNKALCAAGSHGIAMDVDGIVYKCHGIFYSNKKEDNKVTSIYSDTFMKDIEESCETHKKIFKLLPDECKNCYAEFCLKCNSMCYEISQKKTFKEKWNDYPNQPEICDLYRLSTKVKWGMEKILKLRK